MNLKFELLYLSNGLKLKVDIHGRNMVWPLHFVELLKV